MSASRTSEEAAERTIPARLKNVRKKRLDLYLEMRGFVVKNNLHKFEKVSASNSLQLL